MVSGISFKMRQLLIILIMLRSVSSFYGIDNTAQSEIALKKCLDESQCIMIDYNLKCSEAPTMNDAECTADISKLSQNNVTALFDKLTSLNTWLRCDNSVLSVINLAKVGSFGITVDEPKLFPRKDYPPSFNIVNNINLRSIILPHMSKLTPGFFTIMNNPRLSRLSIDGIHKKLDGESVTLFTDNNEKPADVKTLINDKSRIQKYGECDYSSPRKISLTWPQFRWCRTILHDVILTGPEFKPGLDTAYIINVTGHLTIRNTEITDLSMLPVYVNIGSGEISDNKDLCISFADEIRMKRLGFEMKNNKPLSCRTSCDGGTLTLETIKNLKDCVMLNGGLTLNGINATMAAADFFKTIRVINGPVVITNAQVTLDFKELKEIKLGAGEISPHISLTNCTHPILFPNLTTLNGTEGSPMVLLDRSRIDIFNYLNRTYLGKIKDVSRESMLGSASGDIITSVSPSANDKSTPGTVTHGNRVVGKSTGAPGEQRDDREPDTIKPHGTPEEKPVEPITAVSPVGDTDQGAAKNSSVIQRDSNNSAAEGKSNVLMVMTIVSLVIFLASSVTSVGIIIKYSVM